MHILTFTISPEAVARVHDAVLCLSKFSDSVSIEARPDKFILTALNSSKSAYASFCLDETSFFENYQYNSNQSGAKKDRNDAESRFTCQVYNKALLSVFRSRLIDARERDAAVERCEVCIQDQPDKPECRLVVKMICRHGVTKTYRLTYESVEVMHALFDKNAAKNKWTISASVLRSFIEYFGAATEQLDMYTENGRAQFTSYTERIMDGKEILKQPLQTCVAIDTLDFEDYTVEEKIHIGISVKDFKAVVMHAETLKTSITALFSRPSRPMQLAYGEHGMQCEYTLMTVGEYRGESVTPSPAITRNTSVTPSDRTTDRQPSAQNTRQEVTNAMPPPIQPASRSFTREPPTQRPPRPSPPPPKASLDEESLFVPVVNDDDQIWGERNFDEDEDTLGWDPTAKNDSFSTSFGGLGRARETSSRLEPYRGWPDVGDKPLAPTQRISEVFCLGLDNAVLIFAKINTLFGD
ncbi:hypothetical protein MMC07_002784 [Pseudocyphellaria aurata]|nr:hypothetical protein [Pseudocyphellaria aurata]